MMLNWYKLDDKSEDELIFVGITFLIAKIFSLAIWNSSAIICIYLVNLILKASTMSFLTIIILEIIFKTKYIK